MSDENIGSCAEDELQRYDLVPRKVHQCGIVGLLSAAYIVDVAIGAWLLFFAALFMAFGRFWKPFDPFRVLTTAILQPAGLLPRRMVHEDRDTRRVARVVGGISFAVSAGLLFFFPALVWLAWTVTALIGAMILLDATFDVCTLCFLLHHYQRLTR